MANIYKGTIELIGNTPLVEAVNLEQAHDLQATLLIKLEYLNPAGSVKTGLQNPCWKMQNRAESCILVL